MVERDDTRLGVASAALTVKGRTDEDTVIWTVALSLTLAQYWVVAAGAANSKVADHPLTPVCGLTPGVRTATLVVSAEQALLVPL
jgi:hypothetical protein